MSKDMAQAVTRTPEEVITFWSSQKPELQFNATPEFDELLRRNYKEILDLSLEGGLESWKKSAKGSLALVLLLDQFCLNIYRGNGKRYEGEKPALEIAKEAIAAGHENEHPQEHRVWYYMPFMHSEILGAQEESLRLFSQAGYEKFLPFAQGHYDIVKRFGRFPHRNKELNRESTAEELDFLASGGFSA